MRMLRTAFAAIVLAALSLSAQAQKITVGKITSGSGFHVPSYVAMDKGFFKDEGLDASFITLGGRALVTAGLAGSLDFNPISSGGAQAALAGADIRYVVGQTLKSQWLIAARPDIGKPEDLRGKTIGYGRPGSADYDEGAAVLRRVFKLEVGTDYKVIAFQGETERVAALINGDIAAALISVPLAPKALNAGMKILVRTGDYIERAGGTMWARKEFAEQNPETVKKFIRAIAKGVMYYRTNRDGSIAPLRNHLGIDSDKDAGIVWDQTHNAFGAELPGEQFREMFESRRLEMIAGKQWAADKPLPDPEQYLLRAQLESTLKAMNYVPTKLDRPTN